MRFLNKLFKKGEGQDDKDFDPVIEEAFPNDDDEGLDALGNSFSRGYEDQLGPPPAQVESEPELESSSDHHASSPWQGQEPPGLASSSMLEPVEDGLQSEWRSLRLKLQSDPRSQEHHAAVRRAISLRQERIDFYEELADAYESEPYHRLSLARAFRDAGQSKAAIPHYQRYLRAVMDAEVFEELAEVYSSQGETYLASSARQIAQSISKGGLCSSS